MTPLTPPGFGKQNLLAAHCRRLQRTRLLALVATACLVLCCAIPDEIQIGAHYLLLGVVALLLLSTGFQLWVVARADVVSLGLKRAIQLERAWAQQRGDGGGTPHPGRVANARFDAGMGGSEGIVASASASSKGGRNGERSFYLPRQINIPGFTAPLRSPAATTARAAIAAGFRWTAAIR